MNADPPEPGRHADADDLAYCLELVRDGDRDRYLTALLAPADRRAPLMVLYAFKYEVEKTHAVVSEPLLGQIRLQWWRESLDGVFAGEPPRHAVVTPLAEVVRRYGLERALFDRIIDGHERDLDPAPFADRATLEHYCTQVEGALMELAMGILGGRAGAVRTDLATHLGIAFAIASLLRRIPHNRRSGPMPIPADMAHRHGVHPEALRTVTPADPRLAQAVRELCDVAREHLSRVRALRRHAVRADRAAILHATLARGILRRLEKAGFAPFDPRVTEPAPGEIWRLVLAALTGRC